MVDALDIVSLERMRFELLVFPDGDIEQDALLTEQIKSAVAFVAVDTGVNLLGLAADDPRLPYVHRAGRGCRPSVLRWIGPDTASYDFLVKGPLKMPFSRTVGLESGWIC